MRGRPRTNVPEDRLIEAFQRYADENWTTGQFAAFLDIAERLALPYLTGERQPEVPRPEGFVYRRGEVRSHRRKDRDEKVLAALEAYVADPSMGLRGFAERIGKSRQLASLVLTGQLYAHIPRPEGFVYPPTKKD